MYSKFPFTLDIHSAISQVSIPVTRGDTARRFYIGLTDGGAPFILPEDCRAVLTAEKADGTHLLNDCIIEDGGAVVRYDFTEQTASAVGKAACQIKLYDANGGLLAEPRFTMIVYDGYVDENIVSTDEKTTIDQMILAEQARVAAENERIASDAEREEIARRAEEAAKRVEHNVNGDDVFIRYSAYPDGRDYTATWRRGLNYIGVAAGLYEPKDARGYQWSVFAPGIYVGGGDMPDYADVQIDPDGESGFELIEAERIKAEEARVGAESAAAAVQGEVAKAEAERIKAEQASAEAQAHTAEHIGEWLENHPEATASVKDGSLEESKFSDELKKKAIKDYVTPQMFGAKGDGATDDTQAFLDAIKFVEDTKVETWIEGEVEPDGADTEDGYWVLKTPPKVLFIPSGRYVISKTLTISSYIKIIGSGLDNTTLHCLIGDGSPCIYVSDTKYAHWGSYSNAIENLTIYGEYGVCSGVKMFDTHSFVLENVKTHGCKRGGFILESCWSGDIKTCFTGMCGDADHPSVHLYSSSGAFDFGCHGVSISGGEFNGAQGVGLKIEGGSCINVYGTIIEGCQGYGVELGHTQSVLLSGVYTEENFLSNADTSSRCDMVFRKAHGLTVNGCIFMSGTYPLLIDQVLNSNFFGNTGVGFAWLPDAEIKQFCGCHVFGNHGIVPIDDDVLANAIAMATLIDGSGEGRRGTVRNVDGIDISTTSNALKIVSGSGNPNGIVNAGRGGLFLRNDGSVTSGVYFQKGTGASDWVQMQPVAFDWTFNHNSPTDVGNGFMFFDPNLVRPLWRYQGAWVDATGNIGHELEWKSVGTTEERPTGWPKIGFMFFDTTLGKPIWCKESREVNGVWVDCTGTVV